ncbi:MAG: glycosyltransferase family 2 protein [Candidatus Obscuribacterales bacterium]|nr:glycosyltransferase family 2 protein [Candidatus Obscuribacterales bacterium]
MESSRKPGVTKVIVTMPAYNAAKTLIKTFDEIDKDLVQEIILVDDCSKDDTVAVASKLPIKVIRHPHNVGYGGNQKTCYAEALRDGADIVIMLHPDYQYDPRKIPEMIAPILSGEADIVLGSRFLGGGALKGGMPMYKFVANRFLTTTQNIVLGTNLSEFHTGYRAYSRKFLETVPFLRNSLAFVFDAEILCQAVYFNFKIAEIGVETRYFAEASSINFWNSVQYGLGVLSALGKFVGAKTGLSKCDLFKP